VNSSRGAGFGAGVHGRGTGRGRGRGKGRGRDNSSLNYNRNNAGNGRFGDNFQNQNQGFGGNQGPQQGFGNAFAAAGEGRRGNQDQQNGFGGAFVNQKQGGGFGGEGMAFGGQQDSQNQQRAFGFRLGAGNQGGFGLGAMSDGNQQAFGGGATAGAPVAGIKQSTRNARNKQVCRFFLQGHCKFGNQCKFSHNIPGGMVKQSQQPSSFPGFGVGTQDMNSNNQTSFGRPSSGFAGGNSFSGFGRGAGSTHKSTGFGNQMTSSFSGFGQNAARVSQSSGIRGSSHAAGDDLAIKGDRRQRAPPSDHTVAEEANAKALSESSKKEIHLPSNAPFCKDVLTIEEEVKAFASDNFIIGRLPVNIQLLMK